MLITFNGLLLVVLGITVFSFVKGDQAARAGMLDCVNVAHTAVTLRIHAMALAEIVFRLASCGLTPTAWRC